MSDEPTNSPEESVTGSRPGAVSRTFLIADVRGYTRYANRLKIRRKVMAALDSLSHPTATR